MTLDDLERPKCTFAEKIVLRSHQKDLNEDIPTLSAAKCRSMILVFTGPHYALCGPGCCEKMGPLPSVVLLKIYVGSGERRELPQRGPGQSPGRQRILGIFQGLRSLKTLKKTSKVGRFLGFVFLVKFGQNVFQCYYMAWKCVICQKETSNPLILL